MDINNARILAKELIKLHGLHDWTFNFDSARRRFGVCKYRRKIIGLSKPLTKINDEFNVKDTILHEIAHALVGPGHGHNHIWKRKAIEIGCNGNRCYNIDEVVSPESKYIAICPNCNYTHKKHRISKLILDEIRKQSCGRCSNRFDERYLLNWKINPIYLVD